MAISDFDHAPGSTARFFRKDGEMPESVTLEIHQPPCFAQLVPAEWRALLADRIRGVEDTGPFYGVEQRTMYGRSPVDPSNVIQHDPGF